MPIDYEALRGGNTTAAAHPPDGKHQARLDRAKLVATKTGERLVTEWTTTNGDASWTSWNRFDQTGLPYARDLLTGLGIDLGVLTDDNKFDDELDRVTGKTYEVRTESRQGSQGDRWFTSTYVDGSAQGAQDKLTDVPIDTGGLPDAKPADDDIPF